MRGICSLLGIGLVVISANDVIAYSQDSYENMLEIARLYGIFFLISLQLLNERVNA